MTATFTFVDWMIVAAGLAIVVWIGLRAQRYVRTVADFLTASRVAGRYVLNVAGAEAAMGLISLVAMYETYYKSGFAYGFWGSITSPIMLILGLTGYCTYRFRETRAMTMGQFLEIRYSRRFRLFAGILQSVSGIVNYGLFPAVGARFVVYYCNLPVQIEALGMVFPTFALLMAVFLGLAVLISTLGGQVTIMVTDCVQGLLSYPIYVAIVVFILLRFSWFRDLAPVITDRPAGESMINPFDITALRDFNLFFVIVGLFGSVINRMSWAGTQGYNAAARNAHEQKIAGVLGAWRSGFSGMMFVLLAVVAYAYLNGPMFQEGVQGAAACRTELAVKALEDVAHGEGLAGVRADVKDYLRTGTVSPGMQVLLDRTAAVKARETADRERLRHGDTGADATAPAVAAAPAAPATPAEAAAERREALEARFRTARDALYAVDPGVSQTFGTLFGQMRVPMALRYLLPIGLTGLFCALCIFLMLSTDTTYLHSWGSILIQDVVLPIRGRPFTPKQQLRLLRLAIAGVAVFGFFFSYFFGQVDYIVMFFSITGAIWLGGAGVCIVGGLYWKRGSTAGAWAALTAGSSLAVTGILLQSNWVATIYPWLHRNGWVDGVAIWLQRLSAPFEPIILWRMSSEKFPISSVEIYFFAMLVALGLYVLISLATTRGGRVFNMDRMLHRGQYHREGIRLERPSWAWRSLVPRLIGIDNQYTRGDRALAWSVFVWSFGWGFCCCFVGIAVWNFISPWSTEGWVLWFYIGNFIISGIVGAISTVWFTIGGTLDLRRLFRDLAKREANALDDGRVEGHVSADDTAQTAQAEPANTSARDGR